MVEDDEAEGTVSEARARRRDGHEGDDEPRAARQRLLLLVPLVMTAAAVSIAKNGVAIPVRFSGCVVPDTLRDVAGTVIEVTVEGRLEGDSSLEATAVLTKCPSRYEMKEKAAAGAPMPHSPPRL